MAKCSEDREKDGQLRTRNMERGPRTECKNWEEAPWLGEESVFPSSWGIGVTDEPGCNSYS